MLKTIMRILQIMTVTLLISYVASGEDQPLTRLTNHHIYLSVKRRWSVPTVSVIWHFEPNRTKVKIAEFENDISIFHHQQFNNRLELSHSGKKLHIKNLRMEDSGNYVCTITLTNHEMYKEKFKLVVYDPVPPPTINTQLEERTSNRCNVILHCSVPTSKPSLSYIWKHRHKDSDYQLYSNNNKDTIQLWLQPEDMEVMCIVHNPADQKNSSKYVHGCSVNAHSIPLKNGMTWQHYSLAIAGIIFMVLMIWLMTSRGCRSLRKWKSFLCKSKSGLQILHPN